MVARAEAKYVRISPKKVRVVLPLVRGKPVLEARMILKTVNKKGAFILDKLLGSALSNAKNKGYQEDKLVISKLVAHEGPTLKRYRAASFGRATMIRKRTSHILVELNAPEHIRQSVTVK